MCLRKFPIFFNLSLTKQIHNKDVQRFRFSVYLLEKEWILNMINIKIVPILLNTVLILLMLRASSCIQCSYGRLSEVTMENNVGFLSDY